MEKQIIKVKCPDWQSNGLCYYDCKPLHCQDCKYFRHTVAKNAVNSAIVSAMFDKSRKYDNLSIKELRELFVAELETR